MKVLILGSSGMLGYSLFKNLSQHPDIDVFGTVRSNKNLLDSFSLKESKKLTIFDALDGENKLNKILKEIKPDYVLNCIGLISQKKSDHIDVLKLNSVFPHELAHQCTKNLTKLIHFSTDCVFNGFKGNYKEDDIPDANDIYGRSKLLGEIDYQKHLTIRTSIIGHEIKTNLNLVDWFLSERDSVNGYTNAIFSGFPCCYISEILIDHIFSNKEIKGVLHISSEPISKFDLLSKIAHVYDKKIEILEDSDYKTDKTLNSNKFKLLSGFETPKWDDLINKMFEEYCKIHKN